MGNVTVKSLFYADDIVLIADRAWKVQRMMCVATKYAKKWRFEVNRGKSQVVMYGAGNK